MQNPLVSIIMPVYNSEEYLNDSIESLINQKYKNIEIICVDDGSTDGSIDILYKYQEYDNRVKIIKQRNQFAGVARNNGLENALGKYVMFLDSDDIFEKNMIKNMVNKAEKHNTDIIFFGFYRFTGSKTKRSVMGIPYKNKKVISPLEISDNVFQIAQGVPWNKFYNKEFVLNSEIKFQNLKSNNDIFFSKMTSILANRILFDDKRYINYRVNNDSSTQGQYNVKSGNYTKAITAMYDEMIKRDMYLNFKDSFEKYTLDSFIEIIGKCTDLESFEYFINDVSKSLEHMNIVKENKILMKHKAKNIFINILERNFDDMIIEYINFLKINYVSKSCIEYRVGKKILKRFKIRAYE